MEGVLVSAKRDGSNITTTVVTNDQGVYSFPAARLAPGHYTLTIRAVGYTLQGPQAADVAAGKAAKADLTLAKTDAVANQLSNGEWLNSLPGDDRTKAALTNCVGCHTVQRIVQSTHDAAEFMQVFHRMGTYAPGSTPFFPQLLVPGGNNSNRSPMPGPIQQKMADYLAGVNLSNAESLEFPLKPFPRLTGRSTHVIITEYDLPRQGAQPHDVVMDADGMIWYSDFSHQVLGEMDPATGKVTDHPIPTLRPDEPKGSLDLELDPQGNLWLAMMYQAGIMKFDRKTKKSTAYPVPEEWLDPTTQESMVSPQHDDVDGKVWTNNQDTHLVYRLDLATGKFEDLGQATDKNGTHINAYGMPTDLAEQRLPTEFRRHHHRPHRRQDQRGDDLENAAAVLAPAPRPRQRRQYSLVRRIRRQRHRPLRSEDRHDQGMAIADAVGRALRRGRGQGRRNLDRLDDDRPRGAARSEDRQHHRVSAAAHDQHPPRLHRRSRRAAGALGRQQPRRLDREGRAAGLRL